MKSFARFCYEAMDGKFVLLEKIEISDREMEVSHIIDKHANELAQKGIKYRNIYCKVEAEIDIGVITMNYPDNFKGAAHFDNDDMESDVVEIGLRAEYAEYLKMKDAPQISFYEWCEEGEFYNLSELDKKQIANAKAEKLAEMQAKLNNWAKGSAGIDAVIAENERAAQSEINSEYDLALLNAKTAQNMAGGVI